MSSLPFGVRISVIVALSLLAGVGAAYALTPTFVGVAIVFAMGLRLLKTDVQFHYPSLEHSEAPEGTERSSQRPLINRLVSGFLLVWWLIIISPLASLAPRDIGARAAEAAASGGSAQKQLLVLSFGLVGLVFLPAAMKRFDATFRWILILWMVYLGWAYVSLFWSVDQFLTIRRLVAFVLISLGSLGLGAGFYGNRPDGRRLFVQHIIAASVLSALMVLVPLTLKGTLANFLDPAYRVVVAGDFYSHVVRPGVIALMVLVVAPMVKLRRWQRYDWLLVLIIGLAVFVLKTRAPVLYGLLALATVYLLYRFRFHDRVFQLGLLLILALGTYIFYIEGLLASIWPYLTRGDAESTISLTGRIPLWKALIPDIVQHPLLGVGFGAYWTPDNLYRIQEIALFPVVSAHNGFLDELLATGAVGLTLFMAFWVTAMAVVLRRAQAGDGLCWLAFALMLYYLLLNLTSSLMQTYFELPFILVFAILGLIATKPAVGSRKSATEARTHAQSRYPALSRTADPAGRPDKN